jgi:hypothetical protein
MSSTASRRRTPTSESSGGFAIVDADYSTDQMVARYVCEKR